MKRIILSCLFLSGIVNASDYKSQLEGKLLRMPNANCAGISLKAEAGLIGEMGNFPPCTVNLPVRVKWIDGATFMLVEKNKPNEISPPRVFIYKVESIKGNKVSLNEFWTGWNNLKDNKMTYTIEK